MQKRLLAAAFGVLFACVVLSCFAGRWVWQTFRGPVSPTAVPIVAEATASATPTQLPTPTSTPTPLPTHTATITPTPTSQPAVGVMTGHVWMRRQPSSSAPLLGIIIERGESVTIRSVYGEWCQIDWAPQGGSHVLGWVPLQWVGTLSPIPARVTTPTASP